MAFELVEKKAGVQALPSNQVSVSKTSISFGDNFLNQLKNGGGYCEVYLDRNTNKVGFKSVGKVQSGYKIQFDKGSVNRAYLSSTKISSMIPNGRYNAYMDKQGLIVIEVEEILDKNKSEEIDLIRV